MRHPAHDRHLPRRLRDLPARLLPTGAVVIEAATLRSRTVGLAGLEGLPQGVALLIPRCHAVHTFGMRFALDLVFLDEAGRGIGVHREVPPMRFARCGRAHAVVEVQAGAGEALARETPLPCAVPTFP